MADIRPIRPWRYNRKLSASIDALTSPLSDVVSEKQLDGLYQRPYNSIHLSAPRPPKGTDGVAKLLQEWKRDGILVQDEIPAIYVLYQYFSLSGSSKKYCRKGFICHVYAYAWEEKVIRRFESGTPAAGNDGTELLEKTELHTSPTHGLYTDQDFQLEAFMDAAIADPIYEVEDQQGVRNVLAVVHDADVIKKFMAVLHDKQVILADGHQRYEASLIHREKQDMIHPGHIRKAGYNFNLMYLTNTEAKDLKILPTYLLIKELSNFSDARVIEKLEEDFTVESMKDIDILPDVLAGSPWTFGVVFKDKALKIRLKPESFATLKWPYPEEVKKLDLTIVQYFIIEKILGIPESSQQESRQLLFNRRFSDCRKQVTEGSAQMAIVIHEPTIEAVKRICQIGYTIPKKSIYFYPEVIAGFLFTSINEIEFALPSYAPF